MFLEFSANLKYSLNYRFEIFEIFFPEFQEIIIQRSANLFVFFLYLGRTSMYKHGPTYTENEPFKHECLGVFLRPQ